LSALKSWNQLNRQIVACEACSRLREYCQTIARERRRAFQHEQYWGQPVPNFGDPNGRLLIVGLAPAAHGANRTGRMFTGDRSGEWLYRALHKAGFANQAESHDPKDGLQLLDCAITATCHCAPPDNKPTREELAACRPWLQRTVEILQPRVWLALGQIGWQAAVEELRRIGWYAGKSPKFSHSAVVSLVGGRWLVGSYHPSQQNTFTGRLTESMFDRVFEQVRELLNADVESPSARG
jgi:uracil-DNA glycosylase family 4